MSEPLTPSSCNLQDFRCMMIDVVRLFGSEFDAIDDDSAWRFGVTLWLRSWHQVPAGSLPASVKELAKLCGLGRDTSTLERVRTAGALRGWRECSDGRLYHPVVAEFVLQAWIDKLGQRIASGTGNYRQHGTAFDLAGLQEGVREAARLLAKLDPRHVSLGKPHVRKAMSEQPSLPLEAESPAGLPPGSRRDLFSVPREEKGRDTTPPPPPGGAPDLFEEGWNAYPEAGRIKLDRARQLWAEHAPQAGGQAALLEAVKAYAASPSARLEGGRRVPALLRWLGEGRYRDHAGGSVRQAHAWTGPPDLRAAAVALRGEDWTASWLDPCRWRDLPQPPTIIAPRQLTRDRLIAGLRELLKEKGVMVEIEKAETKGAA